MHCCSHPHVLVFTPSQHQTCPVLSCLSHSVLLPTPITHTNTNANRSAAAAAVTIAAQAEELAGWRISFVNNAVTQTVLEHNNRQLCADKAALGTRVGELSGAKNTLQGQLSAAQQEEADEREETLVLLQELAAAEESAAAAWNDSAAGWGEAAAARGEAAEARSDGATAWRLVAAAEAEVAREREEKHQVQAQLSVLQEERTEVHAKFRLCTVTWQKNVNSLKADFRAQLAAVQQQVAFEREGKQQAQAQLAAVQEELLAVQAAVSGGDAGAAGAASDVQVRDGKYLGVFEVLQGGCGWLLSQIHTVAFQFVFVSQLMSWSSWSLALTLCPLDAMLTLKP